MLVVSGKSRLLALTGAAVAVAVAVAVAGCAGDGQSGIPTETPEPPATAETTAVAATTPPAEPAVVVGEVRGNPAAAPALQSWTNDLVDGDDVVSRCWTIAPERAAAMYADVDAITAAVRQPGQDGQFAVTWSAGGTDVSVLRHEIAAGYACPYVHPTGANPYTGEDAVHAVERFLARAAGKPVNPADTEARYPLVCDSRAIWDPYGTGVPGVPPLSTDPDVFTELTSFDAEAATFWAMDDVYAAVTVPVVDAGAARDLEVLVTTGANGYCLGEVS